MEHHTCPLHCIVVYCVLHDKLGRDCRYTLNNQKHYTGWLVRPLSHSSGLWGQAWGPCAAPNPQSHRLTCSTSLCGCGMTPSLCGVPSSEHTVPPLSVLQWGVSQLRFLPGCSREASVPTWPAITHPPLTAAGLVPSTSVVLQVGGQPFLPVATGPQEPRRSL